MKIKNLNKILNILEKYDKATLEYAEIDINIDIDSLTKEDMATIKSFKDSDTEIYSPNNSYICVVHSKTWNSENE